jgi:hypothetical protein
MSRKNRTSSPIRAWKLMRTALSELRQNWGGFALILAVIAVPTNIIGLSKAVSGDPALGAYMSFAALVMNVALIWSIMERDRTGVMPRPHQAFYDGSVALVRFLVVTALLVLMLVPAALGAAIYLASNSAATASGSPIIEELLIGIVCGVLALPSIWMLTRFALAPVITVATGLRPVAAMRYARKLTIGRFWRMFGRYAALVLFLIVLSIPIALVTALLAFLKLATLATLFFQIATTFLALPFANLYIYHLYRGLEPTPEPKRVSQHEAPADATE